MSAAPGRRHPADRPTVGDVRAEAAARLAAAGVPTPEVDTDLLVAAVLGWSRPRVALERDTVLDDAARARLATLVDRRAAREPLQRLVGEVGFRRLTLTVCDGVLVPRPETEVLAGLAIEATPPGGVVVDVGTGTGAVALAVADEADPGRVVATDLDAAAVGCARANAARTGLVVEVAHGDLLAPVPRRLAGEVAVLVSNPPYLTDADVDAAEPEVARHEPRSALVAGDGGHAVVDRLLVAAATWLSPGGRLLVEVHSERAAATAHRARAAGLADVVVHADLAGRDRVVAARRP